MPGPDAIEVEGVIMEVLANKTFWVALANGHRVMAHVARGKSPAAPLHTGQRVILEMTPYDFSQGRIKT